MENTSTSTHEPVVWARLEGVSARKRERTEASVPGDLVVRMIGVRDWRLVGDPED